MNTERARKDFFRSIRDKNLFWSYAKQIEYDDGKKTLLIETVLKYADLDDIVTLFRLFERQDIRKVWESDMKHDIRFKKLNYFLARMFFNLDVEADYFVGGNPARADKIRMLADENP